MFDANRSCFIDKDKKNGKASEERDEGIKLLKRIMIYLLQFVFLFLIFQYFEYLILLSKI